MPNLSRHKKEKHDYAGIIKFYKNVSGAAWNRFVFVFFFIKLLSLHSICWVTSALKSVVFSNLIFYFCVCRVVRS